MCRKVTFKIGVQAKLLEKGISVMKLAWTIYLVGLVLVIIYFNTGSTVAFVIGFGLQLIGFIIQTITKKKANEKINMS